jgi:hypothetical protein
LAATWRDAVEGDYSRTPGVARGFEEPSPDPNRAQKPVSLKQARVPRQRSTTAPLQVAAAPLAAALCLWGAGRAAFVGPARRGGGTRGLSRRGRGVGCGRWWSSWSPRLLAPAPLAAACGALPRPRLPGTPARSPDDSDAQAARDAAAACPGPRRSCHWRDGGVPRAASSRSAWPLVRKQLPLGGGRLRKPFEAGPIEMTRARAAVKFACVLAQLSTD